MTEEQFLKLTGKKLEIALGVILCQDNYLGFMAYVSSLQREDNDLGYGEVKRPLSDLLASYEIYYKKSIDRILLTPDNAFKWRKHTNTHLPLLERMQALDDIAKKFNNLYRQDKNWWGLEAEPMHWLMWSALCEMRCV